MLTEVPLPNYITYSFEEILRWAVIVALVIPQDGHPLDPHWDKRLRDIVDDITGQQRSNFGLSDDEPMPEANRYPGIWRNVIISLENGHAYKQLYDHLRELGLSPDTYRQKWGLPADYPMMAPDEKERRERVARQPARQRRGRGRPRKRRG